jgi:ABC-2 type transport system permease protein
LIAVIFVANLPLLFASTALAPISFMPNWLGWLAALNPLTFAIEPIRAAYLGQFALNRVVLEAPYGALTAGQCLLLLLVLAVGLFVSIRPLLDRKLS